MIKHQCIPLDSPTEWKAALTGINHGFAHTWEHCYAMHLTTGLRTFLYCFETDNGRIVCPIVERDFEGYVDIMKPYGFSGFVGNGDCLEFPHYWKEFARQRGYVCGYIGLNPIFGNTKYFEPSEVYQYNTVYVLDLTLSDQELYANLSKNRKRQLKNWDEIKSSLILDKAATKEFFVTHYIDFIREKNAPSFYYFSKETLSFLADLENVFLVGAGDSGELTAVSVFGHTPDTGEFLFNVSIDAGRNHSTLLMWYGINRLKSLGIPNLNLGGGDNKDDGVAQFKARFGSQKLPLGCVKQIYQPEIYMQLCRRASVDPSDIAGYFPAYRKPR